MVQDSQSQTDAELLRWSSEGDQRAFHAFMARHEAAVFRLVRTLESDLALAEDALQDTFVAAWNSASGFRGEGSARGWLLTIARNTVHQQHRRRTGEPSEHTSLEELGALAGWADQRAPDAFDRLADRALIERRDLEGFTGPEVAEMLGISLLAVKSRLRPFWRETPFRVRQAPLEGPRSRRDHETRLIGAGKGNGQRALGAA